MRSVHAVVLHLFIAKRRGYDALDRVLVSVVIVRRTFLESVVFKSDGLDLFSLLSFTCSCNDCLRILYLVYLDYSSISRGSL